MGPDEGGGVAEEGEGIDLVGGRGVVGDEGWGFVDGGYGCLKLSG